MKRYTHYQARLIAPFVRSAARVLDFGCGDMGLIRGLMRYEANARYTGVDVVDAGIRLKGAEFRLYDGKKLPFADAAFDVTVAYHVLHHCTSPLDNLAEISRVTKKQIILIEPVVRFSFEIPFMRLADRLGNGWRGVSIPMPFTFQYKKTWIAWASQYGWNIQSVRPVSVLPRWLPIGESLLFSFSKRH